MKLRVLVLYLFAFFAIAVLPCSQINAQNLTLEGQTGGFLTPTAYVVYAEKGQFFSHPAIGVHFINSSKVIGNIETVSITESFASRAEVGYTRSIHQFGDSGSGTKVMANAVLGSTSPATAVPVTPNFSQLWHFSGMNVFHGKVVIFNDGQFGKAMPGVAIGGVVRTDDKFVTGAAAQQAALLYDQYCINTRLCTPIVVPAAKGYTNGDIYIAVDQDLGQEAGAVSGKHWLEGHKCHDLRHRRPEYALRRTFLRRPGVSVAHRPWHRGRAFGGLYAGAPHIRGPGPQPARRHSFCGRKS